MMQLTVQKYNTGSVQQLKNYLWHLPKAILFSWINGFPAKDLTLIGITGTKGKTSTAQMVYQILRASGVKVGIISSIGANYGAGIIDTGLHVTSPDPRLLQPLLRRALASGLTHMVIEVTSNGLDQFRFWGMHFAVGVVTNIAPDHLDYHQTLNKYVKAKSILVRNSAVAIVNHQEPYFGWIKKAVNGKTRVVAFGPNPKSILSSNQKMAILIATQLGLSESQAMAGLENWQGIAGRLETVYKGKFRVVIDFAHTPDSLQAAIGELRRDVGKSGKFIAVFGCAGERDPGRRKMGAVAAKLADYFIVTSEDPRSESASQIATEIIDHARRAGAKPSQYSIILDRQVAISQAIKMAKSGDVVGLFGKGHEQSMCFGRQELPWSEHEAVTKALSQRGLR